MAEGLIDYLGEADDVRPFIAAADCVVLPSYREGLPRTLLEAAAMAKPLIATDVPGCRHVVEAGSDWPAVPRPRCGLARRRDDGDDRGRPGAPREQWGRAGRAKVEREFDEKLVAERYLRARSRTRSPDAQSAERCLARLVEDCSLRRVCVRGSAISPQHIAKTALIAAVRSG